MLVQKKLMVVVVVVMVMVLYIYDNHYQLKESPPYTIGYRLL